MRKIDIQNPSILNPDLIALITGMGHTDALVIADAGLPIPPGVRCLDLALTAGIPGFIDTLRAVLQELCVERCTIASEMQAHSKALYGQFRHILQDCAPDTQLQAVDHTTFKRHCGEARAIVRTGECAPYANVILSAGVPF